MEQDLEWEFPDGTEVPSFTGYMNGYYWVDTPGRRVTDWSSVLDKGQLNCYGCNTRGDCWLCHGTGKQKNWLVED